MDTLSNEAELDILLYAIYKKFKMDFTHYKKASLLRRIEMYMEKHGLSRFGDLIVKIMYEQNAFYQLLNDISVPVTEMFRDPHFFLALRQHVLPILNTYPVIKIWVAGCATGQEAFSLACLLAEEKMLDKATIYATDINRTALHTASQGIILPEEFEIAEKNYQRAGGTKNLSAYFTYDNQAGYLLENIKQHIQFEFHNITHGSYIAGINLILCRNVFIYFDKQLQNEILGFFLNSLRAGGFLGLGDKESVIYSQYANYFDTLIDGEKIFRKRYA